MTGKDTPAKLTADTALYRHWGGEGQLLYIGVSDCALRRSNDHKNSSHWYRAVTRTDVEWFPTRKEAELAERLAIKEEKPQYNRTCVGGYEP